MEEDKTVSFLLQFMSNRLYDPSLTEMSVFNIRKLASSFGVYKREMTKKQLIDAIELFVTEVKHEYRKFNDINTEDVYISHSTLGEPLQAFDTLDFKCMNMNKLIKKINIQKTLNKKEEEVLLYHPENIAYSFLKMFIHYYKKYKNVYFNKNFYTFTEDNIWSIVDDITFVDDIYDICFDILAENVEEKKYLNELVLVIEENIKLEIQIKKILTRLLKQTLKVYFC